MSGALKTSCVRFRMSPSCAAMASRKNRYELPAACSASPNISRIQRRSCRALRQRKTSSEDSGSLLTPDEDVPLRTNGLLVTEEQIKKILVDVSSQTTWSAPVYIGDFAKRRTPVPGPVTPLRGSMVSQVFCSPLRCKKDGTSSSFGGADQRGAGPGMGLLLPPDLKLDLIALINRLSFASESVGSGTGVLALLSDP